MNNKPLKVILSSVLVIGDTMGILMMYAILIFCFAYPTARNQFDLLTGSILVVCCGVLPTLLLIWMIILGFYSVITIDEKGIRRAFLGCMLKNEIKWDEIAEMKYFVQIMENVFISKKEGLAAMSFDQAANKPSLIRIAASKKVLTAIRQYTDKEIIGLPEEKLQAKISQNNK